LAPGLSECLGGLERIEQGKATIAESFAGGKESDMDSVTFPVIPDFEVLGELGRGGMGVVYEAKQLSLDRDVALKVLPFSAVDPRTVKRFLREAETALVDSARYWCLRSSLGCSRLFVSNGC
jgi:serine/threonine protein kinase